MRTRLIRGKFTLLFMILGLLLAVPAIAFAQDSTGGPSPAPTIQSDLPDYEPGGLVTLTGGGWQPGEAVNIVVNDDAGQTWNRNVNVTADASGNIIDSFNLPAWFVATYSVKATGASGTVATSSFTDASVTVHRGPTGSPPNVTFTVAYARFADPLCTGTGTNPGTAVVDSDLGTPLGGLGNSNFIKLTAPMTPTTPSGYTFDNWTAVAGSANTTITQVPNTPNSICVRNPTASTIDIYRATYKVAQQATSITQVSGSGTYGGNATLTAKLTQGANNLNGKTVEFKLRNNAVCDNDAGTALQACPTTDANGVATLNNVSLSGIDAGGPTGTGYAGAVSATFAGDTGFSSSTSTGNLTVNKANQTITFPAPTGKTFGDADFDPGATASSGLAVSYSSSTPGVCTIVSGKVHIVSAGTCTVTASQAGNANYNPAPNVTRSFSIGAAQGNVTLSNLTQTYDGSAKSVGVTTTPSGLNVSVTYNGNAQAPTNAGSYNVVATINDPNYQGSATGTLKIDKAVLSVNAKDQSTVYGDSNLPPTYDLSGFVNNETAASAGVTGAANCAISNTGGPNVGTYSGAISCDAGSLAAQNYSFAPGTKGTLSITKAELKVNADNQSKTYGDANPNLTYTFSGFKNGDTAGSVTTSGSASCSIDPSAGPNVGTFSGAITCATGNLSAANYTFAAGTNGEMTITKRAITYTADAKTKTYGENDPALTGNITSGNLVGSDSLSGNLARVTGENVGSYDINQGTLTAGGNYELTYNGAKLTIDKRAIEVTADDKSKTYGEDDPALTHSVTSGNLVNGDAFTGSLQREEGQNAGTYAINQGTLSAGGNYELTFKSGTLTIDKADLTVTADDKSKIYGDANPTFTVSYDGFVNGDAPGSLGGTLAFDTQATAASAVGSYEVTPKGLTSGNYNIDFVKGTLTVNKRAIEVTADDKSKTYGEDDPALTHSVTSGNLVNGDAFTGSLQREEGQNAGTYAINQGTLSAGGNYELTFKSGTLTIDKADLTVTADDKSKTYGDANPTFTVSYDGFKNNDTSTNLSGQLQFSTNADASSAVGTYDVTPSGLTSGNYNIDFVKGTLTVNKRAIEVTADDKSKTYGEDDPALTHSVTSGNLVNGDAFTGSLQREEGQNAGTYAINQGTLSAGGNYELTFKSGTLTIDKADLTVTADDKSKIYGDANPTFTVSYDGFVNGDAPGSLGGTLAFDTQATAASAVGTYDVTPSGLTSGNYNIDFVKGTLTVNKAALSVTADNKSKTYGDANPNFTASYSGFKNGDAPTNLNGTLAFDTQANQSSNVGSYEVTPKGLTSGNYNIDFVKGTLTVNKAALTVTADNKSKIVGAANPTFTGTLTGVKNNDAITASYSTTATQQSGVGTYPIVPSLNDPNNKLSNYNVTKTNGTLTIIYNFTVASGAGFLQPINYTSHQLSTGPDVSTFKAGSTVPVKFVLKDANGNVVQAASPPQWLTPAKGGATTQPVDEALYSEPATTGTTYQWTGSQYHYNWASPKNGSGIFWRIGVKLDDGQIYYVNISLR